MAEAGMCAVHEALLVSLFLQARDGAAAPVDLVVLRQLLSPSHLYRRLRFYWQTFSITPEFLGSFYLYLLS